MAVLALTTPTIVPSGVRIDEVSSRHGVFIELADEPAARRSGIGYEFLQLSRVSFLRRIRGLESLDGLHIGEAAKQKLFLLVAFHAVGFAHAGCRWSFIGDK